MTDRRAPDDDELQLGARPVPRWVYLVVGLAALGVVTGLLVANHSAGSQHDAQRTAPTSGRPPTGPAPERSAQSGVGEPLRIGMLAPLDVASAGHDVWVLQAWTITRLGLAATHVVRRMSGVGGDPSGVTAHLVLDAQRARLWVFVSDAGSTQLREYNAYTLRPTRKLTWSTPVSSAATLGGRLYVVTRRGVGVLDGNRLRVLLPSVHLGAVVADPSRSRLLVLPGGAATMWTISPSGTSDRASLPVEVVKGTLTVTDAGSIWLAGFSSPGPVLAELDPQTFRLGHRSPVTAHVGPGAILLAAGRDHVFVHTGDNSPGLWCLDARTGAPDQFWPIDPLAVAVAARPAAGVVVAGGNTLPLRLLGGCTTP